MKKFLAFLMAAVMVLSFAACSNGETETKDSGESTQAETEGTSVVKIGGIGPLSGDYSNYGLSVYQGTKIAVDEINAAGGINGMQIELDFEDSQGDPDSAVSAYGKLIDWGMDVSLGGVFSGETASIMAAAVEDDMFLITPSGSADGCISSNEYGYRVCFFDSDQGKFAAQYIADNNMADKVGVFYQSDIDYSKGLYDAFKAECANVGIEIIEEQSFTSDTSTSFETQIDALAASGAKVIFMPIYAAEASTFLSQAKNGTADSKFAEDVYFFGVDGLDGILNKVEQAPKTADNVLMLTPFAADNPDEKVQNFVSKYVENYGATPDQFAADGYDAVYIIKQIIEAAGITNADDITAAALKEQIESITFEGITGTAQWGSDGNTTKAALAILYRDGVGSLFA